MIIWEEGTREEQGPVVLPSYCSPRGWGLRDEGMLPLRPCLVPAVQAEGRRRAGPGGAW